MLIDLALTAILLLAAGTMMLPGYLRFMREHRIVEANYLGHSIPTACGLFLLLMLLFGYLLQKLTGWGTLPAEADFMLAASLVGFTGFLDDLVGDKKTKGIASHWKSWLTRGVPSTAVIKAATAGAAGFIVIAGNDASSTERLADLLLLLLATNAANLMDVRPGRALKFFYLLVFALLAAGAGGSWSNMYPEQARWTCLLPVAAGAFILTWPDLKGRIMLGDAGANLLGFTAGCGWVWYAPQAMRLLLVLLLLALHGLTWKRSLTRIIESSRWLSFIDGIGRERI